MSQTSILDFCGIGPPSSQLDSGSKYRPSPKLASSARQLLVAFFPACFGWHASGLRNQTCLDSDSCSGQVTEPP